MINETAPEMAGVDGCLQSSSMSDAECAERIRLQYLGQLQRDGDLQAGLLHRIAEDVAVHCGVSLLKAHRLAWGWTVAQAVEAFHRMCRQEKIKPRGLTTRSWMDWEAGARPNWDYQDLLSRLFQASPVRLGAGTGRRRPAWQNRPTSSPGHRQE